MRGVWARFIVSAMIGTACHDDTSPPPVSLPSTCSAPNRVVGDRCIEPGVADDGCPAGTIRVDDSCQPAGIPAGACGDGFVHDGDVGCEPILPPEPCPKGLMAVPGDRACRAVMECGRGKWGDIPVDASTEHVDASYTGVSSDGSAQKPWTTVQDAVAAAVPNAVVAVAEGEYVENVTINGKAHRLWGVCPEKVAIVGTGSVPGALNILRAQASGTEVHGVALVGSFAGLGVSGAEDVTVESVWVHDSVEPGIFIESTFGPTSVRLVGVLVEQNHESGVQVIGTEAIIERSVVRDTLLRTTPQFSSGRGVNVEPDATGTAGTLLVRGSLLERNREFAIFAGSQVSVESTVIRDTLPQANGILGHGIYVNPNPAGTTPAVLDLRRSLLERNRDVAVSIFGATATIEATVIRDTLPQARDAKGGRAINIQPASDTGASSSVTVRASLFERNREFAMFVAGGETTVEGIMVRDTLPSLWNRENGRGINFQNDPMGARASATVRGLVIERSHELGVFLGGADATIEAVVVRDVMPRELDAAFGRGLSIQPQENGAPSVARVHASLFERTHHGGIYVSGSQVDIEGVVVRDIFPQPSDGYGGRGINVQRDTPSGTGALVTLRATLVERCQDIGIYFHGAEATLERIVIVDTAARAADDHFGDGLVFELTPVPATMDDVRIENSARAALGIFGADVRYERSAFECQSFDVVAEAFLERSYSLANAGDNRCGCPTAEGECILESPGVAAPEPLQ